jgi:ABC-type amino acid transport system permease subunit
VQFGGQSTAEASLTETPKLGNIVAAYIALGLNSGAYQAEYFRGAIQAIGHGQMMTARQFIICRYYIPMEILLLVGTICLVMVLGIATLVGRPERRLRIPGLELEVERA